MWSLLGSSALRPLYCEMQIQGTPVKLQIDCCATVNVMPHHLVPVPYKLNACNITLKMWNKTTMDVLGQCALILKNPATGKKYNVLFVIIAEDLTLLLNRNAVEKMGLITINYEDFKGVNVCEKNNSLEVEFENVFTGEVGKLPGTAHLTLQVDQDPVVCPTRGIPIAIRDKVHDKIFHLNELGILKEVDEPTPWVILDSNYHKEVWRSQNLHRSEISE